MSVDLPDMAAIEGGTFFMGDIPGDGRSDQAPVHQVTVAPFLLSKCTVTVAQFRAFVRETGYVTSAERGGGWLVWTGTDFERKYNASWRNPYFAQTEREPAVLVSWDDAVRYCNWLSGTEHLAPFYDLRDDGVKENWEADGYRLPTEAEWEYAARSGGKPYAYAWGNGGPNGNVADETLKRRYPAWPFSIWQGYEDGYVHTAPVGSFPANEMGLYDMTGNVWQWCNDWYGRYSPAPVTDPRGPLSGIARVLRGGSWTDEPDALRVTFRSGRIPYLRGANTGFRLARSHFHPPAD